MRLWIGNFGLHLVALHALGVWLRSQVVEHEKCLSTSFHDIHTCTKKVMRVCTLDHNLLV